MMFCSSEVPVWFPADTFRTDTGNIECVELDSGGRNKTQKQYFRRFGDSGGE